MRKVLSFVLVLAMILGSVSAAFAFSDTKGVANETAINAISELGLISGYADGTFGADKTITRAEFVTMVVNALGFPTTGSANTGFKDVEKDYWAAQAIFTAKNLGIVYGKTATTFGPKDPVTYDEAIAFMMRALGYQSQYLLGSYPANYINQAKTLDVLSKVKTGSANATRGEVAQLIYNCLNEEVVTYNYFGVAVGGATLLERLGQGLYNSANAFKVGTTLTTGGAFVLTDQAKFADGVNLMARYGEVVTAFANSKGKITGIKTLDSTALTGSFDNVGNPSKFTLADGTEYKVNVTSADAIIYLYNGLYDNTITTLSGLTSGASYTIAADVDGKVIDDVYSVSKWTAAYECMFEESYFNAKTLYFCGRKFQAKANDPKAIDLNSFALLGAESLDAIKEDDVVTVYVGGNPAHITKIEVSDKVVTGTVDKVTSSEKYTIGGTAYKLSANAGHDTNGVQIKAEGSFYLNYAGKIAFFEGTSKAKYAVVTRVSAGTGEGLNGVAPKIEMVLSDGTTAIYEIVAAGGTATPSKYTTEGAATTIAAAEATSLATVQSELTGKLVSFTLTTAGKLATVATVGIEPDEDKVQKAGTIDGTYMDESAVVFIYNDEGTTKASNYAVAKKSDLLGSEFTTDGSIVYATAGAIKAALLVKANTKASTYVVFNGSAEINDEKYDYEAYVLNGDVAETYKILDFDFDDVTAAAIYKIALDSNGALASGTTEITKSATNAAGVVVTNAPINATSVLTTGSSKTLKVYKYDGTATPEYYALAENVIVYVWDTVDEEWTVGSIADLVAKYGAENIALFDTTSTADGVYDIVMITSVAQGW